MCLQDKENGDSRRRWRLWIVKAAYHHAAVEAMDHKPHMAMARSKADGIKPYYAPVEAMRPKPDPLARSKADGIKP